MSRSLEVRDLRPDEHPAWTRLVDASPGDEIRGGIPFLREGSSARVQAVPRLLLFYNGPVLRRYTTRYPAETVKRHLAAPLYLPVLLRMGRP